MLLLKGKTAFITGGASGIAYACCKRYLEYGAKVAFVDYASQEKIDEVVKELSPLGEVYGIRCDVRDAEQVKSSVAYATEKMGRIDIGINAAFAAFPVGDTIDRYNEENFVKGMAICVNGTFLCTKYEAVQMIAQGNGGSIINFSSINSWIPAYGMGGYCTGKAAIEALSKNAAIELGNKNIRVNSIHPGFTRTPATVGLLGSPEAEDMVMKQLPLLRVNEPEDVGDVCVFLGSDLSKQMTGTQVVVDGGMQLMAYPQVRKFMMPQGKFEEVYK